jgi:hypothetical protein
VAFSGSGSAADWFEQDVVDASAFVALSVPGGMEQLADIGHGAKAAVGVSGRRWTSPSL